MLLQIQGSFAQLVCHLGGASGIGRATVERLASEGATVAIFDINSEAGQKLAGLFTFQPHHSRIYTIHVHHKPCTAHRVLVNHVS